MTGSSFEYRAHAKIGFHVRRSSRTGSTAGRGLDGRPPRWERKRPSVPMAVACASRNFRTGLIFARTRSICFDFGLTSTWKFRRSPVELRFVLKRGNQSRSEGACDRRISSMRMENPETDWRCLTEELPLLFGEILRLRFAPLRMTCILEELHRRRAFRRTFTACLTPMRWLSGIRWEDSAGNEDVVRRQTRSSRMSTMVWAIEPSIVERHSRTSCNETSGASSRDDSQAP